MTVFKKVLLGAFAGLVVANVPVSQLMAAEAYPVFTDINAGVGNFTTPWAAPPFGAYTINSNATLNGNAVFGITQGAMTACCHGAVAAVAISNGENGDDGSPDLVGGLPNVDPVNTTPANSVFSTIGNASGKLEDGNVIRLSAWFRSDPANPITAEPQVAPILKIEYWKQGLNGAADTNGEQAFPNFGDRVFDQDQQGYALDIADPPAYVDINNDGAILHEPGLTPASGRVFGLNSSSWTLASVTHTVNSADWLGIGAAGYGFQDVTKIESVQGVIFVGEFSTVAVPGPGTLLVDNMLIEVFKDAASVTPISNPNPSLSESTPLLGDFNNNKSVDAADYTVWRNNLNSAEGTLLNGNGNNDNIINGDDYTLWKTHFGESSPGGGSVSGSAVPEPTSLLIALGLAGVCSCCSRRRS